MAPKKTTGNTSKNAKKTAANAAPNSARTTKKVPTGSAAPKRQTRPATTTARRTSKAASSKATAAAAKVTAAPPVPTGALLDKLRLPAGAVDLGTFDPRATPGLSGGKTKGQQALAELGPQLSDWQERLYAEGRTGGGRSVLLVLQGMDTSGKGGVIRHGAGLMDPQGLRLTSFKAPTAAEKRRGFLWRIRQAVPAPGYIGIFDRSHYEDVLIARVRNLVPETTWSKRYDQINEFEQELAASGVTILKCFLHISNEEQKKRLVARLDDPGKRWKYNPADVDERELWPAYAEAYEAALERCNDPAAPWYVIPSDRKWYRNWAVTTLLLETLKGLDPQWPRGAFDLELEKKRVAAS
jgi:PPK2 family polyphosphate:nucleotide phosphotransferase